MEAVIDANAQLDYIEFQIFSTQNRFDASVCCGNKKEKAASGTLEHLLPHSPNAEALKSKGSSGKYKVTPPENTKDAKWFTKSTLIRFLNIISSSNVLEITKSVKNEISQLEEARKFHVSLYAKSMGSQLQSVESDSCFGTDTALTPRVDGLDASKNELLRAIDLRLNALHGELTAGFVQAAGSRLSVEEITDMENFSNNIGSVDLRDSFRKHIQMIQRNQVVDDSSTTLLADSDIFGDKGGINEKARSLSSDTPVRYGVSPAKVAQLERQSSTGSDTTSLSSEEEQPSAGRSRSLVRSASPRRSASPMRRVQIGRSGSRRSTAITIKSLNHIPARDKSFFPRDSDDEGSDQATKKSESNARVISVKDAINLFEGKQKDQTVDVQKARSLLTASVGANKSVLRRWSSGMGEESYQHSEEVISEDANHLVQTNLESVASRSSEAEAKPGVASDCYVIEPCGLDPNPNSPEQRASGPLVTQEETIPSEHVAEKTTAPDEWSRQKEAELNELLMKMMETKPVKSRNLVPDSSKRQSFPAEKRGGLYDHYKEKRDEKLRGETSRKKAEKDKQFKAMQQVLDARKSQLTAANTNDAGRKHNVKKPQKAPRDLSQPANTKTESPRLSVVKKASTKASSLPATRKSLPSMPSSRASGASPAKTPPSITSTGPAPTRRRSQPPSPVSRVSPKVGKPEQQIKSVNSNQVDSKKTLRCSMEKKPHSAIKQSKTEKTKVQLPSEISASSTKPSLYSKVTKKSSVVPLESKPFLRRGTGTFTSNNQLVKKKVRSVPQDAVRSSSEEPLRNPEEPIPGVNEVNETVSSNPVIQHQESDIVELPTPIDIQHENSAESIQVCKDVESFKQNNDVDAAVEPGLEGDIEEESTISPTAWVEIEEQEDRSIASGDHLLQTGSPAFVAPVGLSSPRVRHSLSQMLLEETSEPDMNDWGNAENPQPTFYQKDAPKGLKRLLKFARKSKTDTNSTGWSSPSVFSEGEDDAEDWKFGSKRNSENLLKKATLQSKNNGHQKIGYDAYQRDIPVSEQSDEANITKFNGKSLFQQMQEGHASASVTPTATKATRSFFSLSAFKGSK